MITELTNKQEKGITEWRDHCLKVGRDTGFVNKKLTEESWKKFYGILGLKTPRFWYCQSPLQANIIINIFPDVVKMFSINKYEIGANISANISDNIGSNIWANIRGNIRANIGDNIRANIRGNIRANIGDNIGDNIGANIRDNIRGNVWANISANIGVNIGVNIRDNIRDNVRGNVWANIWANIGANIWDNISDNIGSNIWANIRANIGANIGDNMLVKKFNFVDTYSWGQHDISWVGYCLYFEKYGLLPSNKDFEIMNIWNDLANSCGWCYTFENIVFVCEKPCKIFLNQQGRLHADGKMALEYSDGYGLWMLNGVRVPRYLAETPKEKLSIEFFKKEGNADVRAEFIRKFGIEGMTSFGEVLETASDDSSEWERKSEYQLINMGQIFLRERAIFLKMKNQSTGIWHLEGVSPECKTIKDALNYRYGSNIEIQSIK